ncbi:MAG TPA: DMT family transporter [Chitinophagaceae bacterium]|nr:DMT family transporter [Chitinophagaceae bacterium]
MKQATKAHLALLSTNLFFALNYSLVKIISPVLIKPFALNVLRVGFSLLFFWSAWAFGKKKNRIRREHWGRFIMCGITGVAINQMLFIKGLTLTSTVHASLLILITPLLISLFALVILKEALTIYKISGLLLGIGGSVLLVLSKENSTHAVHYLLGDTLIIINAASYAAYFILVKPLMQEYTPLQVIRAVFTIGFVVMLPFGWLELQQVSWASFEATQLLCLAGVIITGTFLAYLFTAYGIQHLGAAITGAYIYTQPVFAVLLAAFFLSETINGTKVLAAVFIFAGVYLVNRKQAT